MEGADRSGRQSGVGGKKESEMEVLRGHAGCPLDTSISPIVTTFGAAKLWSTPVADNPRYATG